KVASLLLFIYGPVLSCHHGHRGHGRHSPPFLRDVSDKALLEYYDILSDDGKTIAQQKAGVMNWAVKYGIENQVKEFNTHDARTRKEIRYNVTKLIDDLPLAIDRFFDVMDDEYQTREERRKELEDISAQNPKLYRVLRFAIDQFQPRHGLYEDGHHHGRHHGSHHHDCGRWRRSVVDIDKVPPSRD
uniref:ANIS5_cation-bd domain-containing protein n=1 Tax=Haemonchus contortus TaxID=6289 RepID=A0A7I5EA18_HAECO